MSDWKRIDSIADVRRGASPRPIGDPKYFGGEVGWVRISDVTRSSRFLRETEQYLSPIGEALSVRVNSGDLVMSICGTLGRPIIIDMPACIHDGFVQFTNLRDADTVFLFYALQYAEAAFCGMGQPGTQTNLNTSLVGRHTIFCPSLSEQRHTAKILSTLDETIEQTEALIAKMQQIKVGLMHDLFTRGVTPDGHLRPAREQAPGLYKDSLLGWIPRDWEVAPLLSFAASRPGCFVNGPFGSDLLTSELKSSGVPVIYVQDIKEDEHRRVSNAHVTEKKANELLVCNVRAGDVLVAKVGDPPGIAAAYSKDQRAVITQDVIRIRPADDVVTQFLASLLNSPVGNCAIRRITIEGTRARVSLTEFKKLLLPKPKSEEQQLIAERLSAIQQVFTTLSVNLCKLKTQKHGLMHDLLTGRIRVID